MTDREKFEAWFSHNDFDPYCTNIFALDSDGEYLHEQVSLARKAWQAALASQQPSDDAWIEWAGGECPVAPKTVVQVRCVSGASYQAEAVVFKWQTVIAYRVVKP